MSAKGLDDSAILLLSLGEEAAAEVFKHLAPKEVQKLGSRMARIENVSRDQVDEVLERFEAEAADQTSLGGNSDAYIKSVLTKALGQDKANFIIERILSGGDTSGIEGLKWMDAGTVAELIKNEHPQIIASILVHLERDHASEILNGLPERVRSDVILRIATLDGIQPAALKELNDALAKVLAGGGKPKKAPLGGARTAAEILNFTGTSQETAIIDAVKEYDQKLAQEILDEMFVFDNVLELDDKAVQMVLREISGETLVVALKGCAEDMREKIFRNMSQRAADQLREDLESKGPVKLSEVEGQQKEILKIVRRLADEGQIALGAKGEDAYV